MTAEQLIAQIKKFKKVNSLESFFFNTVCLKYGLASFGSKAEKVIKAYRKTRRKLIEGKQMDNLKYFKDLLAQALVREKDKNSLIESYLNIQKRDDYKKLTFKQKDLLKMEYDKFIKLTNNR